MSGKISQQAAVEFIGTFFLVFAIGMSVLGPGDAGALAPLAIGAALMVMVYAGGHISGAHYNPAVTLAVLVRGKTSVMDAIVYWVAQVLGAAAGAGVVLLIKGAPKAEPLAPNLTNALIVEALITFALAWVVLNVATARGTAGNSFYGLAIGFTVTAGAFAVGPVSGGVFNPAVAVATLLYGITSVANLWIYLVANLVGGALAGLAFLLLAHDERDAAEEPAREPAAASGGGQAAASAARRRRR